MVKYNYIKKIKTVFKHLETWDYVMKREKDAKKTPLKHLSFMKKQ